jgi:NAD(P)-dependent dehydrogenase (short-subunit alcohol dehydrogenase family)
MKYAIQAMLKTGGGNIVNVSSGAGLKGLPMASHYVASKHALMGLTKSTAIEYATKNIRVNVVAPGPIRTEMYESVIAQGELTEEVMKKINPMNKIGEVDEVAKTILFLGSDDAPFMTGAVIAVDGGFMAQ